MTEAPPGVPGHGGNLARATALYGEPQAGWIDLSTGINPEPYPFDPPPLQAMTRLPEAADEAALADAAARFYGTPATVVPGAGSQAFIQLLPKLRPVGRIAVLSPTYTEHAYAWREAGHAVEEVVPDGDLSGYDAVVAVNPNNPDGRRLTVDRLLALHGRLAAKGGWLVVDEAFGDCEPAGSLAPRAGGKGLVVLRSFGKFFGLAGLRLGFALTEAELAMDLRRALGPWSVAGPAIAIGRQALADQAWHQQTRSRLAAARERLDGLLAEAGHRVLGGTDLFRLVATDGRALHERLARAGIWTRAFERDPNILRLGLPGGEAEWKRLAAALA